MDELSSNNNIKPTTKVVIPTIYGIGTLLVIFTALIIGYVFIQSDQKLEPTPMINIDRTKKVNDECRAGGNCAGPTVSANDPEGDELTYKFYDKETGELVREVTAASGEEVTPEFSFNTSGEKELYMVVEDGSGHTSKNYPIIIPVK